MRDSTKDRLEGKYHEAKGKVKEVTGQTIGKPNVAWEGTVEKNAGKAEESFGKIKEKLRSKGLKEKGKK